MSEAAARLVAEFEAAAKTAQQAEDALRRQLAEEVDRLERRRAFAFRRASLVRVLADAAVSADTEEAAAGAQRAAVRRELEWGGENESSRAILDRLQPVGRLVWQCTQGSKDVAPPAIRAEFEAFEAWFEAAHGNSFYALFDQYVPEVPVVEF